MLKESNTKLSSGSQISKESNSKYEKRSREKVSEIKDRWSMRIRTGVKCKRSLSPWGHRMRRTIHWLQVARAVEVATSKVLKLSIRMYLAVIVFWSHARLCIWKLICGTKNDIKECERRLNKLIVAIFVRTPWGSEIFSRLFDLYA